MSASPGMALDRRQKAACPVASQIGLYTERLVNPASDAAITPPGAPWVCSGRTWGRLHACLTV